MKFKLFPTFSAFIFLFLFLLSCQSAAAQNAENQNRTILFVSRSDKNIAPIRPRILKNPARKEISANLPLVADTTKAVSNFADELRVFELINKKRVEIGLIPLLWNDDVAKIARVHSEEMANSKFFDHKGLDGSMVNNRADANGLSKWSSIGENIAYNRGFANPLEFAVEGWMKSPAHRENILDSRWQESGIGIAIMADGTYYFTQVFLLRK